MEQKFIILRIRIPLFQLNKNAKILVVQDYGLYQEKLKFILLDDVILIVAWI